MILQELTKRVYRDKIFSMDVKAKINENALPEHVAIIMDGNGRWASRKGKPRTYGHVKGVDTVRKIVAAAARLGIRYLTLYVFSQENWSRPQVEVKTLMQLIIKNIRKETKNFKENGIRLKVIGNLRGLPSSVSKALQQEIKRTENNRKLTLVLAINYSGRQEIIEAARQIVIKAQNKEISTRQISESLFSSYLNTSQVPDPELVIRTSGENRISNFLLWQIAYAQLLFVDKSWPDFTPEDFSEAIASYQIHKQDKE
jgi:undecaprenyl diphosphate synthase